MGCRKGEKIMKIPAEFEDIFRGVELTEREALFLSWITSWDDYTIQNMRTVVEKVRSALSTLQAENEKLRAELKSKVDLVFQQVKELDRRHLLLEEQEAELEQVKREQDAAISDLTYIARTYPVDLCDDLVCQYCKHYPNVNTGCPGWTDNDCFEWRGQKED